MRQIRAFLSYMRKNNSMYYWRSTSQFEVDLILDNLWAIEIKGTKSTQDKHLKGLRALKEEGKIQHFAVVSCDRLERKTQDGISIIPWKVFLKKLWNGKIV